MNINNILKNVYAFHIAINMDEPDLCVPRDLPTMVRKAFKNKNLEVTEFDILKMFKKFHSRGHFRAYKDGYILTEKGQMFLHRLSRKIFI